MQNCTGTQRKEHSILRGRSPRNTAEQVTAQKSSEKSKGEGSGGSDGGKIENHSANANAECMDIVRGTATIYVNLITTW